MIRGGVGVGVGEDEGEVVEEQRVEANGGTREPNKA